MKYDFLERGARTNCIKDYEDFFYVLKKHLGGVVQQKYVAYFLNHTSEIMSLMCELGLLKRVYLKKLLCDLTFVFNIILKSICWT